MNEEHARILLVEDNPDDSDLLLRAMKRSGLAHTVHRVKNGVEALAYLLDRDGGSAPRPAVVLLDLHMPQLDGLEVLRRLRAVEETKALPVVTMLGSSGLHGREQSLELGASATLEKPVGVAELTRVLDDLGVAWRGWQRPD